MNHIGDTNKMVSDTPRMDLALRKAQEDCTESYLLTEGLKLERELNAANDRIKRLEEAGSKLDKTADPFVLYSINEDFDEGPMPMSEVIEHYEITYDSPPTAGDHVAIDRARKDWRKAKEAKL